NSYTVSAVVNDANYQGTASGTLIIAKANQTIDFGALADKTFGGAPFAVTAAASSGLPVTFSILSGPATIAGNTVTLTGGGAVTVRASQAGNADYNPAPDVDRTFTVAKATATVTLGGLTATYDGSPKPVTVSTVPAGLATSVTYNGSATVPVNANTYSVSAVVNDANYQGSASGTLVIAKAPQTISFGALPNKVLGAPPFSVNATASSGLPVTFRIVSGPATISGNTITITGVGTVTVRAAQAGNENYNPAPDVDRTFTVAKATATVSLSGLTATYDGSPKPVTVTTAPVGLNTTVTYNGSVTVPVNANSYTVSAVVNDANYQGTASGTLIIAKANQTIDFGALADKTFGGAPFAVTAAASSGLPVTFSILSGPATIAGNTVTLTGGGAVTVRAVQAGDANYNSAPAVDQTFVASIPPAITVQPASRTNGLEENASFQVTATGSAPLAYQWRKDGVDLVNDVRISGVTTALLAITGVTSADSGIYTVLVSNGVGFITSQAATLTVLLDQNITFSTILNRAFSSATITLAASSTSLLPVQFQLVSGPARLVNNVVTLTGVGSVTVRATQPGNESYNPASPVERTFQVTSPAPQVLTTRQGQPTNITFHGSTVAGLTYSITAHPAHGVLSGTGATRTYAPEPGNLLPHTFSYAITDPVAGVTTPVVVYVNIDPVEPVFQLDFAN
ncbi:MAG: MBG domain-containing protein, partial [Verrucomicrobiota bacterium]